MPRGFRKTPLYGGALECELPDNFADVRYASSSWSTGVEAVCVPDLEAGDTDSLYFFRCSTIRQVPDNQEVYIDKDGFTSIIFDITQRVDAPGSGLERDGKALTIHLEDLVGDDADSVKVWNTTETQFTHLGYATPLPFLLPKPVLLAASPSGC